MLGIALSITRYVLYLFLFAVGVAVSGCASSETGNSQQTGRPPDGTWEEGRRYLFDAPDTDPQPIDVVIKPDREDWKPGEPITGWVEYINRGNGALGLDVSMLWAPRLLKADRKPPMRVPAWSGWADACIMQEILVLQPGEKYRRSFSIAANPRVQGNLVLANETYILTHRELREGPTTVREATIRGVGFRRDVYYTVENGDTLAAIANRFLGDPTWWRVLVAANPEVFSTPDQMWSRMVLRIPGACLKH